MTPRVTQTSHVYFDPGDGGKLFDVPLTGTDREVGTGDPYVRTVTVGEEWRPLDIGHVTQCSLMVLVNERTAWDRNPTPQQVLDAAAKIVEVSHGQAPAVILEENPTPPLVPRTMFSSPAFSSRKTAPAYRPDRLIYPGEHDKGVPMDLSAVRIRCRSGSTRCTLYLFPA